MPEQGGERTEGPDVSVVVATRNRSSLLSACLDGLARQRTAARFEVVVVDNGSRDATAAIVSERALADGRFRLVHEPVAGLSRAKNAGLASARAEIVLFTDDDVVLDERWIDSFVEFLRPARGTPVLAGGPVLPVAHDLGPWPTWVGARTADLPRLYHGDARRPLHEHEWLWGANMGARRELLEAIGGFDESLGNSGEQRGTFEDVDLVQRVAACGGECWYLPGAVVHHRTAVAATRPRALAAKAFARGANDVLRSPRGGHVERALPVPRRPTAAAPLAPVMLTGWMASALVFRVTHLRRALDLARRLAWATGWCLAAAAPSSTRPAVRAVLRLADRGRRLALALTPP